MKLDMIGADIPMETFMDTILMWGLFQSLMTPSMGTCGRMAGGFSRPRWTMVSLREDPGLRHGGEAVSLVDGGLGGATHQHDPARLLMCSLCRSLSRIAT